MVYRPMENEEKAIKEHLWDNVAKWLIHCEVILIGIPMKTVNVMNAGKWVGKG